MKKLFTIFALITFILCGCGLSADSARSQIESKGIHYDPDSFLKAVKDGRYDLVQLFVKAGIDINTKDPSGKDALMLAASKGDIEIVTFLLANGARLTTRSNEGYNALMFALESPTGQSTSNFLQSKGAKLALLRDLSSLTLNNSDAIFKEGLVAVSAKVKNNSRFASEYPRVKLSLTDVDGRVISEKTFLPSEYVVPPNALNNGISKDSEVSITVKMNATEKAEGFRISLLGLES